MLLIRAAGRLALSLAVLAVLRPAAWWTMRRQRRAIRDMRRASYLATRARENRGGGRPRRDLQDGERRARAAAHAETRALTFARRDERDHGSGSWLKALG